ncbi:phytase [Limibacter armeniacum]|uniref:phytase n=1 Tax=Limibacter armeniacum TaxID=466084 RepID=UPI002FE54427
MKQQIILLSVIAGLFTACGVSHQTEKQYKDPRESDESMKQAYKLQEKVKFRVQADAETQAVLATTEEDAADDPAMWIHPEDPSKSLIVGTHKKKGLYVYDLAGNELGFYPVGKVNNVDIRQGVVLGQDTLDIVAASNRNDNSITLMKMTAEGKLVDVSAQPIMTGEAIDDIYGFCMYQDQSTGNSFVIANGKNGVVQQWALAAADSGKVTASLAKSYKVPSQPEGMVADDATGTLYIGEEAQGIWKVDLSVDTVATPELIASTKVADNEMLEADLEGIALYKTGIETGYLLASSQGNFSYAVFSLENNYEYLGSFAIEKGKVDGVEETDGIEVITDSLSEQYPKGMLMVQDGFNFDDDSLKAQNFKMIDWRKIEQLLVKKEM